MPFTSRQFFCPKPPTVLASWSETENSPTELTFITIPPRKYSKQMGLKCPWNPWMAKLNWKFYSTDPPSKFLPTVGNPVSAPVFHLLLERKDSYFIRWEENFSSNRWRHIPWSQSGQTNKLIKPIFTSSGKIDFWFHKTFVLNVESAWKYWLSIWSKKN